MHSEADRGVRQCQDSAPEAQVATQVETGGVRSSLEPPQRPKTQGGGQRQERGVCQAQAQSGAPVPEKPDQTEENHQPHRDRNRQVVADPAVKPAVRPVW